MDRFDFGKRIKRALRTPNQIRAEQRKSWEKRQRFIPNYSARELLTDSRGLFTPSDEMSKMDGFLASHSRLVTQWRTTHLRMVINVRAARRDLETKIRAEGLNFFEKVRLRRNLRANISLLQTQGARRSYLNGTLSLNYELKSLYRFSKLKSRDKTWQTYQVTGATTALLHEAKRQSGKNPKVLHYETSRDQRLGTYTELKLLQESGLATMESPGLWRLDRWNLTNKAREYRPPPLAHTTVQQLRELQKRATGKETGFQRVTTTKTATRQALGELETYYPQASRLTARGQQINFQQLNKALYADRANFIDQWAQQQGESLISRTDYRLAQVLAMSTQRDTQAIYHPNQNHNNNNAQTVRYLRGLAMQPNQNVVRMGQGGSFIIDRPAAIALINQQRQALFAYEQRLGQPLAPPAPSVIATFRQYGKHQQDGSWQLDPSTAKLQPALVWRLHHNTALNPTVLQQTPDGSYHLSYATARIHSFPGTPEWATHISERYAELEQRTPKLSPDDFLTVTLQDQQAPLSQSLAANTQDTYMRVARNQRDIPLEKRAAYLVQRANELERSSWWLEHAVMRRELRALELDPKQPQYLRKIYHELRTGIETMNYAVLRQEPSDKTPNPARQPLSAQAVTDLKANLLTNGDQELHDALVIIQATGMRPGELAKGVRLEQQGKSVRIHIQGGKRATGIAEAEPRFRAARGMDRVVVVTSKEVNALARRHNGYFRPESSPDLLRKRLREIRNTIPNGENIRFYSFRHAIKHHLELEGHSRADIARIMGHQSHRSQSSYSVLS